jgi:hypothetical protein
MGSPLFLGKQKPDRSKIKTEGNRTGKKLLPGTLSFSEESPILYSCSK